VFYSSCSILLVLCCLLVVLHTVFSTGLVVGLLLRSESRLQLNFDFLTHQMAYKFELNGWQLHDFCLKKPYPMIIF